MTLIVFALLGSVVLAACRQPDAGETSPPSTQAPASSAISTTTTTSPEASTTSNQTTTTTDSAETTTTAGTSQDASSDSQCDFSRGFDLIDGSGVELARLGESGGVTVEGAVYPHPDYEGNPWSQWGQGLVLDDGRFISAIGDHIGRDGNSYIYEYDPSTGRLKMVADILSFVDHEPGSWGYGKVHGQIAPGPCGELYISTYWGTSRGLEFGGSYSGDLLMRLDPSARTLEPLEVPIDRHGQASLASAPALGLVYGEARDPIAMADGIANGPFFVYDVRTEEVVYVNRDGHVGYRNMMVDESGRAYFSIGDHRLAVYDPTTNQVTRLEEKMPGEWLRASTYPAPDGRIFGVTREPDRFFVMDSSGEIDDLGEADGYTTSMALAPDGSHFYYMPHAHGGAWREGAPLIRVDGDTGRQEVVVRLDPIVKDNLGYTVGGTYNMAVSPDGSTVYIGVNASRGDDSGFGEVILLVVHLP